MTKVKGQTKQAAGKLIYLLGDDCRFLSYLDLDSDKYV